MKRCLLFLVFAVSAAAAPALWHDSGAVASLDLATGPGGPSLAPAPPFTFVSEDPGGTSPKITVKDSNGRTWSVKFGEEAKAEAFASRMAWAAGYFAEPSYLVREGRVEGAHGLSRAAAHVQNGAFRDARFELRDDAVVRYVPNSSWNIADSRFKDSRELAGLKLLFALLSNWDVKPQNLAVLEQNGRQFYAVTDWGATMGRASDFSGRSKWGCDLFAADSKYFVEEVENGFVRVKYEGKDRQEVLKNIRVDDVKWFMQRMSQLSDAQIEAALRASGATDQEVACYRDALRTRLGQLQIVAEGGGPGTVITETRREIKIIRKTQ